MFGIPSLLAKILTVVMFVLYNGLAKNKGAGMIAQTHVFIPRFLGIYI